MGKVIRNITKLTSPVTDTAFNIQTRHGSVGLKKVVASSSGICQSLRCANTKAGDTSPLKRSRAYMGKHYTEATQL